MHRYRRAARAAARYDDEREPASYNPLKNYGKRRREESNTTELQESAEIRRTASDVVRPSPPLHLDQDTDIQRSNTEQVGAKYQGARKPTGSDRRSAQVDPTSNKKKDPPDDSRQDDVISVSKQHETVLNLWRPGRINEHRETIYTEGFHDAANNDYVKPEVFTLASQVRATIFNSWFNILLLAVPPGFAVRYTIGYSVTTFVVNFVAVIPLVLLVGFGADEIQIRVGRTLGNLINISASNIAQIITSILLLKSRQILVLRTGLIGGILCSILLVLGLSFLFGGFNRVEQHYNLTLAHTSANMLSLASTSLIVPTVSQLLKQSSDTSVAKQSRGAAVLLLIVYAAFILFQLKTHSELWSMPDQKANKRTLGGASRKEARKGIAQAGAFIGASVGGENAIKPVPEDEEEIDDIGIPSISLSIAVITLIISTTLLAFHTDFAVNSIDQLSQQANLSKNFIGLVVLPLLNNVDPGPMLFATKDRVTTTISITVGKCLQTALLITPLMVIVGWGMSIDAMTLYFDGFEVASLFASVILLNYLIIDGKSNWDQGVLLVADWGMIALAAFFADV